MPIKQITPNSNFDNYLEDTLSRLEKSILEKLFYVGERCVIEARDNGTYIDRSKNLRNSIGYVIAINGNIVSASAFKNQEGASFAKGIVREYAQGIVLIVVAGMNYAKYVSARGYNVLDSSEILATKLIPKIMKELGFKLR
ncbi:MAG: hypothetical protein ACRCZB_04245 [Bacteroidales bacterium]